jgi:hypothetical protein
VNKHAYRFAAWGCAANTGREGAFRAAEKKGLASASGTAKLAQGCAIMPVMITIASLYGLERPI